MEKQPSQTASAVRSRKWRKTNPGQGTKWARANKDRHNATGRRNTRPGTLGWATKKLRILNGVARDEGYAPPSITREELINIWGKHNRLCDTCGQLNECGKGLALDHDHQTGEFRGWLCIKCNQALGLVGDSKLVLKNMLEYLG